MRLFERLYNTEYIVETWGVKNGQFSKWLHLISSVGNSRNRLTVTLLYATILAILKHCVDQGDLASLLQVGRFWHITLESWNGGSLEERRSSRLILIMTFYFLLTVKNFQQCIQFRGKLPRSVVVATFSIYAHFLCIWSLRECCTLTPL